jgi:hypothetical protein
MDEAMPEDPKKKLFSYAEACAMLPDVRRITDEARGRIEELQGDGGGAGLREAQSAADQVIRGWAQSLTERGLEVKGLWLVDWDNGSGYYCWQYPEAGLHFYHSYEDGFRGRVRIQ